MKKNADFVLEELAGSYVLVPLGRKAIDFNGIVKLNSTAVFLWQNLPEDFSEEVAIDLLVQNYKIDHDVATTAVKVFIQQTKDAGCIE